MYDTVAELNQLIKDKEESLVDLKSRFLDDFDLFSLVPYEATSGYESYTTSAPRNFFDKVTDGLDSAELSIQIKLPDNASEEDRRRASTGELYLFGALNEVDRNLRNMGEPPLRSQLGFYACLRGWLVIRALVFPQKDQTVFDVLPWDILHTTWEMGPRGILWAANKRKLTKSQIYSEYEVEIRGKDAELIDWWDEERNAITIESDFAKKPTIHHLNHVPVFINAVGTMPTIQTKGFASTIKYRGDSVYSAARGLYAPFNKITSRTMDIYERSIAGSIIHASKRGDKALEGDPYKTFQEIKISVDEEEEITPLETPRAPPETAILHSILNQDITQSTLPYPLAYGGTRQAMSGAALGILVQGTKSVFNPRTSIIEQAYIWLCEEFLSQYKERGRKPVNLKGFKPDGKFFVTKVKPKEIDPEWFVSVRYEPKLPRDREQEIMMSLAATQRRSPDDIPLLSKQTAREDILLLRDPDAEEDKALEEMGEGLPPIMAAKIAAALKARGKEDLAQDVLALLSPQQANRAMGGSMPGGVEGGVKGEQVPVELLMAAVEALAASGNSQLQQLALVLAKYVKGPMPQGGLGQGQLGGAVPGVQGQAAPVLTQVGQTGQPQSGATPESTPMV